MKRLKATLFGIAIIATFGLVAYSLYLNRSATAGVAAAFMLALILIQQLPILESFEILTLKARFRAQIDEAADLLTHLRESASISARGTYMQLAYMNRMGDLGWDRKRSIFADVDRQLRKLGVPEVEIAEYKRPFLNMLTFDLGQILQHAVRKRLQAYRSAADELYQERFKGGIRDNEGHRSFLEWKRQFSDPPAMISDPLGRTDLEKPRAIFDLWLNNISVSPIDREALRQIAHEIADLAEDCWTQGTVTQDTEAYLDRFAPHSSNPDRVETIAFEPVKLTPPLR